RRHRDARRNRAQAREGKLRRRARLGNQAHRSGGVSASDRILIAGGGVGGLSSALALARKGWSVRVFEQAREFGAIGYGIQLGPNAFHMFEHLGVLDAVMEVADLPVATQWHDAYTGEPVLRLDTGPGFGTRFGHPYIIIHRVDLHNV